MKDNKSIVSNVIKYVLLLGSCMWAAGYLDYIHT